MDTVNCKFGQHEIWLPDRIEDVRIIFRTSALGFALSTDECISYAAFLEIPILTSLDLHLSDDIFCMQCAGSLVNSFQRTRLDLAGFALTLL